MKAIPKPNSNQRSLAGEYYVAYLFNLAGYDTALTIGSTKSYDIFVSGPHGARVALQVKANLWHYDWLVRDDFPDKPGNFIVFVRLSTRPNIPIEVHALTAKEANRLISRRYTEHSPRIARRDVLAHAANHDLTAICKYLDLQSV